MPRRAQRHRILAMLAERQITRATFFTLGWIAERYPALVRASWPAAMNWPATAMATSAPAT
jgi:peptidoglycan/xylan/chitin deacetylase (PgdA/CDA1 family)